MRKSRAGPLMHTRVRRELDRRYQGSPMEFEDWCAQAMGEAYGEARENIIIWQLGILVEGE